MTGIPSVRPATPSLPPYGVPVDPVSWPTATDDVRGGGGRPVVAVVLASGSAAGRCGPSLDTLAAHLPGAGDRHRCWSCGRSWPCGPFTEAAHIVQGHGIPVLTLVPTDLCGAIEEIPSSAARLPKAAGGAPGWMARPTPAEQAVTGASHHPSARPASDEGRMPDRPIEQVGTAW